MGVGGFVGAHNVHFAVARHNLHTHTGEMLHHVQNCRGRLLTVQGRALQHGIVAEIIQQRTVAGDRGRGQRNARQRRADRLRRAPGCHGEQPAHLGKQLDHRAVAGRQPFLGRKQCIVHITYHKGIAEQQTHTGFSFLKRFR